MDQFLIFLAKLNLMNYLKTLFVNILLIKYKNNN